MFSTLIISKSRMNLFLTKQKMPTLRPVTACSVRAVDESVFISLAERQNKSEWNLYTLSEQPKKQFVFFMSTVFKISH